MTRTETGWCIDCGVEVGPYHHDGGIGRCDQCAHELREEQVSVPNPFEPAEPEFSVRLDYDLLVIECEEGGRSIAPYSIGDIKWCETDLAMANWIVRITNIHQSCIAYWLFYDKEEAMQWHAHLHNLWRDARIVAGRAK